MRSVFYTNYRVLAYLNEKNVIDNTKTGLFCVYFACFRRPLPSEIQKVKRAGCYFVCFSPSFLLPEIAC